MDKRDRGGEREREPSLFVDFLGIAREAHVANRGTQAPVLAVDLVYRPAVGAAKAAVECDTVVRRRPSAASSVFSWTVSLNDEMKII